MRPVSLKNQSVQIDIDQIRAEIWEFIWVPDNVCVCVCIQGNLLQIFKIVGLPKPLLFFWGLGGNYEGDAQYWALSWDRDCSAVEGLALLLSFPHYDGLFMASCSLEAM